jgi:hypothetical protein
MVNQILVSNPALKGVKGDQGNSATDAQVAAAVQAYISANEEVFKGADAPPIDYSQIITEIEAWMQTDAIKPIFTGDAANVDTSALQTSIINAIKVYMDENPNQFKGVDGTSPSINYTTVIEGIKSWMTSSPEVISIFKGAQGNVGLPAPAPDPIDYNIVKNDVDNYLSANLSALVSPTIISNAFVDSSGNLISSLSSAISTSTSQYLAANPPAGASQSQVDGWIASYLSANPQGLTSDQVNTAIGAYLVANPQGLTSSQVNSLIAAYLVANPPAPSLTIETLSPLLVQLGLLTVYNPVINSNTLAFLKASDYANNAIIDASKPPLSWTVQGDWSFSSAEKSLTKTADRENPFTQIKATFSTPVRSFVIVFSFPSGTDSDIMFFGNGLDTGGGGPYLYMSSARAITQSTTTGPTARIKLNNNAPINLGVPLPEIFNDTKYILQVSGMSDYYTNAEYTIGMYYAVRAANFPQGTKFYAAGFYNYALSDAEMNQNYEWFSHTF